MLKEGFGDEWIFAVVPEIFEGRKNLYLKH
jgi:hypothetical protein